MPLVAVSVFNPDNPGIQGEFPECWRARPAKKFASAGKNPQLREATGSGQSVHFCKGSTPDAVTDSSLTGGEDV